MAKKIEHGERVEREEKEKAEVKVANINLAARKNFRRNNMEMRLRNRKIVRKIRRRKILYREKNIAKLKNRSQEEKVTRRDGRKRKLYKPIKTSKQNQPAQ